VVWGLSKSSGTARVYGGGVFRERVAGVTALGVRAAPDECVDTSDGRFSVSPSGMRGRSSWDPAVWVGWCRWLRDFGWRGSDHRMRGSVKSTGLATPWCSILALAVSSRK
jgi:hypothetical protein